MSDKNFTVVSVKDDWIGERLDKIVSLHLIELSRSRIQDLIENGSIYVNAKNHKPSYKLRENDVIKFIVPDPEPSELTPESIHLNIIFEDEDIIVLNKPRNMVVHPGAGIQTGTLVHAVLHHCSDLSGIGGVLRPGIVHRLDRGTSGVIVIAKNDRTHTHLANQFAERSTRKHYLAIVSGNPLWADVTVDQPIKRHPNQRIRMIVSPEGRPSVTRFKLLASGNTASLINAEILTGRTHQIRVHLEYLRYPVLGDSIYGIHCKKPLVPKVKKLVKNVAGFCLHAYSLEIMHPTTGKTMLFKADVPLDMVTILESLDLENASGNNWKDYL